jgi:hypothetical protein
MAAGPVGGEGFEVASLIHADANKQRSIAGQDRIGIAIRRGAATEYLAPSMTRTRSPVRTRKWLH